MLGKRSRVCDAHAVVYSAGLSAGLYEDGYLNISNTDISSIVISQMTERYEEFSDMDCTRFAFVVLHNAWLCSFKLLADAQCAC